MKQRIISATVVLAIFIPILILGGDLFKAIMVIVGLLGLKEIMDIRENKKKFPLFVKLLSYFITILLILNNSSVSELVLTFDYKLVAILILFATIPLVLYADKDVYDINDVMYLIGSVLLIGMSFNLLIIMRNYDIMYVIYLFLITTITDTFAHIAGTLSGRHKLCPAISPNKTIEGLVVGVLVGAMVACTFYYIKIDDAINVFNLIGITLFLSLVGELGDLVFSSIKRCFGVKDFSNIMPGHGGVLDRLDSIIFVLFSFLIFISII